MTIGPDKSQRSSTEASPVTQTVTDGGVANYNRGQNAVSVMGDYFKVTKGGSISLIQTVTPGGSDGASSFADSIFGQGAAGAAQPQSSGFTWSPMIIGIMGAVLLGVFWLLKPK